MREKGSRMLITYAATMSHRISWCLWKRGCVSPGGCHVDSNSSELCDSWSGCLGLELAAQRPYVAF